MRLHRSRAQFIELLAVGDGRMPVGTVPDHLSAPQNGWEHLVIVTVRPEPNESFQVQNLSITRAQAERLVEDVKWTLEHDPILTGAIVEE